MKDYTRQFAENFKQSYSYTMGGSQTVVLPNGQEFEFDERQYYSGRGNKYNRTVNHDEIGRVIVTKKQIQQFKKLQQEKANRLKDLIAAQQEKLKRIEDAKKAGVYSISENSYSTGFNVELSEKERESRYFDAERLAKTFDITVKDAALLKSTGKTYVFAKTATGKIIELYHSSLSVNSLSIFAQEVTEERLKEFNHEEWAGQPYAGILGQTENINHFVC